MILLSNNYVMNFIKFKLKWSCKIIHQLNLKRYQIQFLVTQVTTHKPTVCSQSIIPIKINLLRKIFRHKCLKMINKQLKLAILKIKTKFKVHNNLIAILPQFQMIVFSFIKRMCLQKIIAILVVVIVVNQMNV